MFVVTLTAALEAAGYIARLQMLTAPGFSPCKPLGLEHLPRWPLPVLTKAPCSGKAEALLRLQMWPCNCS